MLSLRFHQNLKQLRHLHCVKWGGGLSPESPFIPAVTAQYQSPHVGTQQSGAGVEALRILKCHAELSIGNIIATTEIQGNIKIFKNFQLSKMNPG